MIDDLELFLKCAATLEADAADGYDQLAATMDDVGDSEVAALFARFAEFSRMHLAEVVAIRDREIEPGTGNNSETLVWPDEHSPENPLAHADLEGITPGKAIEIALETERRACDFYSSVAGQTRSERVQELAQEFAEEEGEHVAHLKRWLERLK